MKPKEESNSGGTSARRRLGKQQISGQDVVDEAESAPLIAQTPEDLIMEETAEKERLRKLNMRLACNIAIPVFYFMLGFNLKLPFVASRQYLRRVLKASPANQAMVLDVIAQIPWQLKLFYAFASDSFPINGQRRKPMMIFGIIIFTISWVLLGLLRPAPSIGWTSVLLFLGCFGMIMTDVMADCLVVEKVALEKGDEIGKLQTQVWFLRFAGSFVGMAAGGILLQFVKMTEQNIFFLQGLTQVLLVLPLVLMLEDPPVQVQSVAKQLSDIWVTIKDRRVSYLIFFMFVVGCTPNAGSAFTNFILGPLKFSDFSYMVLNLVGIMCSAIGIWLYRLYFRGSNLRVFVFVIIFLGAALQLLPLILVSRINLKWGISDFWFAIGDELIVELVGIMIVMPMLIVCAKVSPENVEGSVYSFLTMSSNISFAIGNSFSALITAKLGISVTEFKNLWLLICLASASSLLPLFFVWLLPSKIESTVRIRISEGLDEKYKSTRVGLFSILLIFGGLVYSVVASIAKVANPKNE
jgi:hypothetical protein